MKTSEKKSGVLRRPSASKPNEINRTPYADIMQLASLAGNSAMETLLRQETGSPSAQGSGQPLSDSLRARFESASSVPLDDVRVHYNSPEPIPFMARAFTRGSDIHIAPGEEDTLAHEVTHAVQQKQGRVWATSMMNSEPVNEDKGLEREANSDSANPPKSQILSSNGGNPDVIQMSRRKMVNRCLQLPARRL